ncbi:MAG TPA: hypothetical protein VG345_05760 [Bryobacteraceae bacterium]|nr:hypothetical protein [Bryobacteraceae bacterium]
MAPNLSVAPVPMVKAAKGSVAIVSLNASLPAGYHANSNKPTESYLIPLTLKWTGGPLDVDSIDYPKGKLEKYSFSDKPLSVVTGEFAITTKFRVKSGASSGPAQETGSLRYQACDNHACYPPKNVPVNVTVQVQ